MKAEDEAAIYLEECGINGDAMLDIHEDHVDDYEKMKGSIYAADLMAGFAESKLQALKEDVLDLGFVEAPVMRRRENDDGSFSGHRENAILVEREEVINLITNLEDK